MTNQPLAPSRFMPSGSVPSASSSSSVLPYHIRDSSSSAPSSSAASLSSETQCAVCGDGHAKLHYGVLACYGCKGFFRRTLTGNYQYVCRFGNNCVVDRFQRNSCRCCRFKRCLDVGMDPKAVRPDRDLTGKQRVPRVRKRAMDEELITHMMRLQGDEWSRKIPVEAKVLLMQLLNIESKVAKGDCALDQRLGNNAQQPPDGEQAPNRGEVKTELSLRELFEQQTSLTSRRTEMCYEPYRMARAEELPKIAHRGAIAAVDWVESLAELIDTTFLDTQDKIALVKACYAPLTIFNFSARTAQNTRNPDILCLCSYSFVPRKLPSDFNGSNHLSNNLIDRTLNELVAPLRKLCLMEEEVVPLKAIIILDPNAKNLSSAAQRGVAELRDRVQDMLFQAVKELHPAHNASSRFGNLLLLLPTITTLSGVMCENMQFCEVFGWTDPLLNELFETDTGDKGNNNSDLSDGCSLFSGCTNLTSCFSPPMLENTYDELCNPADISLHLSPGLPPNPSRAPTSVSTSASSTSSPHSSSPSTSSSISSSSSSRSARTLICQPVKCEMSTQTELLVPAPDGHYPHQDPSCSSSPHRTGPCPLSSAAGAFFHDSVPLHHPSFDLHSDQDLSSPSAADLFHSLPPYSLHFASDGMAFASSDPLLFEHHSPSHPDSDQHNISNNDTYNDQSDSLFGLIQ